MPAAARIGQHLQAAGGTTLTLIDRLTAATGLDQATVRDGLGVPVRNVSVRHEALLVRAEVRDRRRLAVVVVG